MKHCTQIKINHTYSAERQQTAWALFTSRGHKHSLCLPVSTRIWFVFFHPFFFLLPTTLTPCCTCYLRLANCNQMWDKSRSASVWLRLVTWNDFRRITLYMWKGAVRAKCDNELPFYSCNTTLITTDTQSQLDICIYYHLFLTSNSLPRREEVKE